MATINRSVACQAEIVVCDFCGHETIEEVTIGSTKLDRGDFSGYGHHVLRLWPGHPHRNQNICNQCYETEKFMVAEIPALPDDAVRIRRYEMDAEDGTIENIFCECRRKTGCDKCRGDGFIKEELRPRYGLRLPHHPLDQGEIDHMYGAMVLHRDRKKALTLTHVDRHFVPATEIPSPLRYGDREIVVTDRWCLTRDPCVFERTEGTFLPADILREQYGTVWAGRLPPDCEAVELNLRVPVEILR